MITKLSIITEHTSFSFQFLDINFPTFKLQKG
jgi:hypothetical protein